MYTVATAKFNERIAWRLFNNDVDLEARVGLCVKKGHMLLAHYHHENFYPVRRAAIAAV